MSWFPALRFVICPPVWGGGRDQTSLGKKKMEHIILRTKNDSNGNPRRVSLLIDDCEVVKIHDHGYGGKPREWPEVACTIDTTISEYKYWKTEKENI